MERSLGGSEVGSVLPAGSSGLRVLLVAGTTSTPVLLVTWSLGPTGLGWIPAGPWKGTPGGGSGKVQAPVSGLICSVVQESQHSCDSQLLPPSSGPDGGCWTDLPRLGEDPVRF